MTHLYVTWLIHMWHDSSIRDMTYLYVTWLIRTWHDSFIRDMTHDSSIRDTTHSYVTCLIHTWHDSVTRGMTRSYVRRTNTPSWFRPRTILSGQTVIQMCVPDMEHIYSDICVAIYIWVITYIRMSHYIHTYASLYLFVWGPICVCVSLYNLHGTYDVCSWRGTYM